MADISTKIATCLKVAKKYEWLLNSYVSDFYVDDHWNKLPLRWQNTLEQLPIEALAELLLSDVDVNVEKRSLWPLELLALRQVLRSLDIRRKPRRPLEVALPSCPLLEHRKLKHMFMKCVKPKKSHEIRRMAVICAQSCQQNSVDFVVDFGAGLGHLARILGYGFGINVCCFEMQADLNQQAVAIDVKLESMAVKHINASELKHFKRPVHLTQRLNSTTKPTEFIESIREAFQLPSTDFQFGIIGLHPCGDLGATLMRMFLNCKQAKFLNFVGCCYQKMSTEETQPKVHLHGYPLSSMLRRQLKTDANCQLSYEAREIACHAVEMYYDRLIAGQHEYLKIHSLRAAAERIIVHHFPDLRHSALRNVKYTPGMIFNDYFQKAVEGTRFAKLNSTNFNNKQIEIDLLHWKRIVCFYTLRLMFAPHVESIILYDRVLFLLESGCQVNIEPIFDPRISPRNHITSAVKS